MDVLFDGATISEQMDQVSLLMIGLADFVHLCDTKELDKQLVKDIIKSLSGAILNRTLDTRVSLDLLRIVEEMCAWRVDLLDTKRLQLRYEKEGMERKRPDLKMPHFVDVRTTCCCFCTPN